MSRKFDRKEYNDELRKRTQESDERKEGEGFSKYFKEDMDLLFAKFGPTKDKPHIIDIIPFRAGADMPLFMRVKEGKPAYYLDIYVHQNIGGGKKQIVCPARNYDLPCPICEYIESLVKDGKEYEDYEDIAPKRRSVYNIINMTDAKEEKKGIQIWEVSHKYGEKAIQSAAKNPRGGGSIPFSSPDKDVGQSICFNVDNDTYKTISGHKLVPRDYDIDDDTLENAYVLDQIVKVLPYKEIKAIFNAGEEDGSEDERTDKDPRDKDEKESRSRDRKKEDVGKNIPKDECPEDLNFGEDIDTVDACATCSVYDSCAKKADELEEQKRKDREKKRQERKGR